MRHNERRRGSYVSRRERLAYLEKRLCVGDGRDPIHYGRQPKPDAYKDRRKGR